jgi:glycosyltransferase involved in cell wall biosynthesis
MHGAFRPIHLFDVDLDEPPSDLIRLGDADTARVLIRVHTYPIGQIDVPFDGDRISGEALRAGVERELGSALRAHRAADLAGDGREPACQATRRRVLEDAPTVTVIIPTRDRPELLAECLETVLASEYPEDRREVLIVDNVPSDDRTRSLVEQRFAGRGVRYLRCDTPGSAAARNAGVEASTAQIVAMTDDDVVVDRHWLVELVAAVISAPDVACATGLVVPLRLDTPARVWFEEYGGFGKGYEPQTYGADGPSTGRLYPFNAGAFGSGNNVAFRREELRRLGGYDPLLGNGTPSRSGEDFELFLRVIRSRRRLAYTPAAVVHHLHRADVEGLERQLHDYGVGLSAVVTRTLVHDPRSALEILRRLPYGLFFALSGRSPKNASRSGTYPPALRRAELRGILRGPAAYLRAWRNARGG